MDKKFGLLSTKDNELFSNIFWNLAFYIHIVLGGLALLIGWTQFSSKIRTKNLTIHSHLHLGFDMKNFEYKMNGRSIKVNNQPFLHVGHCIHVDVIKKFLLDNNVKFYEE